MKKLNYISLIVSLLISTVAPFLTPAASSTLQAQEPLTVTELQLAEMPLGEWSTLIPAGDTQCGHGDPYQYFVRPADDGNTDKLMVYFQGGGACWNTFTCAPDEATFDYVVKSAEEELGHYRGIFDFENPLNPVADYNFVFLPYCTGDVHTGDSIGVYGDGVQVYHYGVKNTNAVLDWTFANFTAPQEIVVTGSSAGAYGAIYHTPFIIDQYPDAHLTQLGDAGIGATPTGWEVLETWGFYKNLPEFIPALAEADTSTFNINQLYLILSDHYPDVRFSQFTNRRDSVQIGFYLLSGVTVAKPPKWDEVFAATFALLGEQANFFYYVVGGTQHTTLARPEFYQYTLDGVPLSAWVDALIHDAPIESHHCTEPCSVAEVIDS